MTYEYVLVTDKSLFQLVSRELPQGGRFRLMYEYCEEEQKQDERNGEGDGI